MDISRIAITVAPTLLICGLIGFAFSQNKLPAASAAPPPKSPVQAIEEDDGDDVQVIELKQAPDALRAAVAKLTAEKNIKKVSKETDEDVTVYEIEYESEGKLRVAEISEQGDVFEISTELKPGSLPERVLKTVKRAHPKGTVREANLVQVFFYEVEVMEDGKAHQMRVSATGEILGPLDSPEDEQPLPVKHVQH